MVEYSTSCLKERGIHLARMVMPVCNLSTWEASQEACSSSSQPVSHSNNIGAREMSQQLGFTGDSDSILSTHEERLITACNSSYLGRHRRPAHIHIPTHRHGFVNLFF